jgi:hypothetical protein
MRERKRRNKISRYKKRRKHQHPRSQRNKIMKRCTIRDRVEQKTKQQKEAKLEGNL